MINQIYCMEPFVYYWKLKVYFENQAYFKGGSEKNKSRARAAGVKGGRDESTLTKYSITLKLWFNSIEKWFWEVKWFP